MKSTLLHDRLHSQKDARDKDKMGTFSGIPLLHHNPSSIFWFSSSDKLTAIISTYNAQWKKWLLDIEAKKMVRAPSSSLNRS